MEATDNQEIERLEAASRESRDVWVATLWNGVRQAILHNIHPDKKKSVIEFHGNLEVVDSAYVFDSEKKAYTAAWLQCLEAAHARLDEATKYKKRVDGETA